MCKAKWKSKRAAQATLALLMFVLLGERRNGKIGIGVKHTSQRIPCTESTPRTSKLLAINTEFFYSEAFFTAKVVWILNLRKTTVASWHKISARS